MLSIHPAACFGKQTVKGMDPKKANCLKFRHRQYFLQPPSVTIWIPMMFWLLKLALTLL